MHSEGYGNGMLIEIITGDDIDKFTNTGNNIFQECDKLILDLINGNRSLDFNPPQV